MGRRAFFSRIAGAMLALSLVIASVSTAFADPRDFILINGTGTVISEVYVAPSNLDDWGEDVMGVDVLGPGENVKITFARFTEGDCYYDIKVITAEGAEGELNQVNLCETNTVTFN
ncbi:MAG: hypothetical protein AB7P40_25355 [Chloroflexota bacterium]